MNPDLYASSQCVYCSTVFRSTGEQRAHRCAFSSRGPFVCGQCGKAFPKKQQLQSHENKHSADRPFGCIHCGSAFKKAHHLTRHVRMVHKREPPTTLRIADIPNWPAVLEDARQRKQTEEAQRAETQTDGACPICLVQVQPSPGEDAMLMHFQMYHTYAETPALPHDSPDSTSADSEAPANASLCEWFELEPSLDFVYPLTPGDCVCTRCHQVFTDRGGLALHKKVCGGSEAGYVCEVCGRRFEKPNLLSNHSRSHSLEQFACSYCNSHFTDKGAARTHMRRKHKLEMLREAHADPDTDRPVQLENVVQWVRGAQEAQRMIDDRGFQAFTCPKCKHQFTRKDNCEMHMRRCVAQACQ